MTHQTHPAPKDADAATDGENRNRDARAADSKQKQRVDQEELARLVAEENESKGKLPRYPGLERWQLLEKMGDGAFSNVYRARDLEGQAGEVAIKVVRKFEMNATQVCIARIGRSSFLAPFSLGMQTNMCGVLGRRSPPSGFQETAKGRRGAPN